MPRPTQEPALLTGGRDGERVDIRPDGEAESAQRHGERDMHGGRAGRALEAKALAGDVSSERHGAGNPGSQAPELHVAGRERKHDADECVRDADEHDCTNPRVPA